MWICLEDNKPCDCFNHDVHESWDKSSYKTYEEAKEYMMKWLGIYAPYPEYDFRNPYDYSGYGNIVQIIYEPQD